uniref:Protein kinase putative n=1 Tax=Albugo laibachii Nc14 TaxID=890382 RepID=F0WA94_9STRA|nr:protein kinase putative [Albugo laibachii Nc14]|eukprot:CCA18064.1 protein kinase putative [Albugo laibachii Nc14]
MTANQSNIVKSGLPLCEITHTHTAKDLFTLDRDMIKIGKELGKGAFSVVYVGEYRNEAVAVKCQPKDEDGSVPAFVCKEINALQRFKHPRVLNFVGAADSEKTRQIWIVSEKLGQSDLDHLLKDIRSSSVRHIGWKKLIQIALDAAEGINYLHSMRCIHRDIKPHNILLDLDFRAKLCDFGFVTDLNQRDQSVDIQSRLQEEHLVNTPRRKSYCGTDAYMAPEMYLDEDYDESVDTFSYGVMLMEMVCCRQANRDGFLMRLPQCKFQISMEEFLPQVPDNCPKVLINLAERCTSFEPCDRPQWEEIIAKLRSLLVEQDISTGEDKGIILKSYTSTTKEPELELDEQGYEETSESDDEGLSESDDTGSRSSNGNDEELSGCLTSPRLALQYNGQLLKRNRRGNRRWCKKWFIVDGAHLHYFDMANLPPYFDTPRSACSTDVRNSRSSHTPSTLLLSHCRIWKTMEMPELCFNVVDENWKIKRELQACNRKELKKWLQVIDDAINYATDRSLSSGHVEITSKQMSSDEYSGLKERSKEDQVRLADHNGGTSSGSCLAKNNEIEKWLATVGLTKYTATFMDKGFVSLDIIREKGIETEDLNLLGINDFLAKKLLTLAVRQLQNTR